MKTKLSPYFFVCFLFSDFLLASHSEWLTPHNNRRFALLRPASMSLINMASCR